MQFKFLQLQYPTIAVAFERLLLAVALPLGAAVQTWGVVAAVGASAAAYYLAVLLGLMYYALVLPQPSSFFKPQAGHGIGESPFGLSQLRCHFWADAGRDEDFSKQQFRALSIRCHDAVLAVD